MAGNYFRLSGGKPIEVNEDLNDPEYWVIGNYYCMLNVVVATLKNCPTPEAFTMKVIYGNGNAYPTQIIRDFLYGKIYYRVKTDTPQPWKRLADESMLQWKTKEMHHTITQNITELNVPEIAGSSELVVRVGIYTASKAVPNVHVIGLNLSSNFEFISENGEYMFSGFISRTGETSIKVDIGDLKGYTLNQITIADVSYR